MPLSYYVAGHNLKIQSDIGSLRTEGVRSVSGGASPRENMEYRLQVQYIF